MGRGPGLLGGLHSQRYLVRPRVLVLDQEPERPLFRRGELHLALRSRADVLANLVFVHILDKQMDVRLVLPVGRGHRPAANESRTATWPFSLISNTLFLNANPLPASIALSSSATAAPDDTNAHASATRALPNA